MLWKSCGVIGLWWFSVTCLHAGDIADNWHQWRGPEATGVSRTATPPFAWSESKNVHWKVDVEGQGGSSPIVWDDKIFLLTAVDTDRVDPSKTPPGKQSNNNPFGIKYPNTFHDYVVLCLDRDSGDTLWRRVATTQVPAEGHHLDNDFASSSPTTDGERLYVWFGSAGLFCYSLDGDLLWQQDLGSAKTRLSFGEGSSPVVEDDLVIVTRDQEGQSYIMAFDARNGEERWRQNRDEPSCWATPIVVERNGQRQLITNGHNRVRSYDLRDGTLLWECSGQVSNVIPSPVSDGNRVVCMSGYRGSSVMALPLDGQGDLREADSVLWKRDKDTPYVPSPLLYDGYLYFNRSNDAILTCLDAKSGDVLISRTRMQGLRGVYASPVGAQDRVYFVGRSGTTLVLEKGPEYKVLASNHLDEHFDASPALAGDQLFLRGEHSLYCLKASDR